MFSFLALSVLADGEYDWIAEHVVLKTTENEISDERGILQSVDKVQTSTVTISQTLSERKQRDKVGNMVVVSRIRTTVTTNTDGNTTTVIEKELLTDAGLVVTMITSTKKTANGSITTVQALNDDGQMEITRRTTISKDEDGMISTTVETLNKDGQLIIRQVTRSY
jgi:hypothetical protein